MFGRHTRHAGTHRMGSAHTVRPVAGYACVARPAGPCSTSGRASSSSVTYITRAAVQAEQQAEIKPLIPVLESLAPGCFVDNNTVYREQHRIRGAEAGPDQRASILTVANLLQEVGANHGVCTWGRSDSGLASVPGLEHLVFVATRMQIRMDAYPKWGDVVQLETYYAEESRLSVRREWVISDAKTGQRLGCATSTWVTINMQSRRLAKLPDDVRAKFIQLSPGASRYVLPSSETKKKLPELTEAVVQGPVQVARRTDMDANGHINNVTYLAWAMETVSPEVYEACQLREVEIDFKAECHQGDLVECLAQPLPSSSGNNGTASPSSNGSNGNGVPAAAGSSSNGAHTPGSNGVAVHVNGTRHAGAEGQVQLLHTLRKREADGSTSEVWRARTTWVPRQQQ